FGNCHSVLHISLVSAGQRLVGIIEAVAESVGHGYQFNVLLGRQRLHRGSRGTAATTDHNDLDRVVHGVKISGVGYQWHGHDSSCEHRALLYKVSSRLS